MRKTNIWFLNLLFFTGIGLGSCNQADKDSKYITVNVNENYPEKELVLQDFMDVEYIPLETTDEFITQGAVLSISDKYILIKNYVNDGNIYVFDRKTGKGIRKINRKGQGGEEYAFIVSAAMDEDNEEIFSIPQRKYWYMICPAISSVVSILLMMRIIWMSSIMTRIISSVMI